MNLSQLTPALIINLGSGVFIGDFFGFLLSLPTALFLAFWLSAVKSRWVVVLGAFIGCLLGFIIILGWVGTLIFNTELPGATGAATFFGSVLFCSILGLSAGMLLDLIVARRTRSYYRRSQQAVHQ
jgi:biotin transporter BioY